jgi:hypothetical protein
MIRVFRLLVVLLLLVGSSWALPAFVQSRSATTGASATTLTTTTWTSSTVTGNLIAVFLVTGVTPSSPAVTDSVGNTYVQCGTTLTAAAGYSIGVYYAKNITGGASFTITGHTGSAAVIQMAGAEFSGLDTTAPCDKTASAEDTTTSTALTSGNTATTSTANEALIGGWLSNVTSGITFTAGTSWTARETISDSSDGSSSGMQTRIVSSAAAYQSDVTLSNGAATKDAYIATFKEPAAGGSSVGKRGPIVF